MHFAFLTVPSSGQFNVQLATAQELLQDGHRITFYSGPSFAKHIQRFQASLVDPAVSKNLNFISLGDFQSVADFTPTVRTRLPLMRRRPGDIRSLQACIDIGHPSWKDHQATAQKVFEEVNKLNPDMVVVDSLAPAMINGVRMTKRKFYLTIPCSPGLTAASNISSPHAASARRTGLGAGIESCYLRARDYLYCIQKPCYLQKSIKIRTKLGLKSFGLRQDVTLLPPYWKDENCLGGIHFNPAGLNDCPQQPSNVIFVGAGIPMPMSEQKKIDDVVTLTDTEVWLDECETFGLKVIFINLGSMFSWTNEEFTEMLEAMKQVYEKMNGAVRFLFKVTFVQSEEEKVSIPSYVRISPWIEDQQAVYQHPAVKVFLHHGGGNSFNEAVFFGVPQIIISQWLDTHEYGFLVERFKLGVHCSKHAPWIKHQSIVKSMLQTLDEEEWQEMKRSSMLWSTRSRLGGGPATAAKLLSMSTSASLKQSSTDTETKEDPKTAVNSRLYSATSSIVEKSPSIPYLQ